MNRHNVKELQNVGLASLGGMLEYASLLVGHAALIGLATAFYLTAILLAYQHEQRAAQVPLSATP